MISLLLLRAVVADVVVVAVAGVVIVVAVVVAMIFPLVIGWTTIPDARFSDDCLTVVMVAVAVDAKKTREDRFCFTTHGSEVTNVMRNYVFRSSLLLPTPDFILVA